MKIDYYGLATSKGPCPFQAFKSEGSGYIFRVYDNGKTDFLYKSGFVNGSMYTADYVRGHKAYAKFEKNPFSAPAVRDERGRFTSKLKQDARKYSILCEKSAQCSEEFLNEFQGAYAVKVYLASLSV